MNFALTALVTYLFTRVRNDDRRSPGIARYADYFRTTEACEAFHNNDA